jgi:hypothetical protein
MSLSAMVAAYIDQDKEEKERDPKRLFLSDIGKCPREVTFRLSECERDHETQQELINKSIMFDLAERIEDNLTMALLREGILIAAQRDVSIPDRENWGGRFDILADYNGRRVIEVKSIYPGAFNYDLRERYPQHHHQANAYDMYCRDTFELDAVPLLSYWDRGGQNTPQEVEVRMPWSATREAMDELDTARASLPDVPPRLGKVLVLRNWSKNIVLEPDSRCRRPYCKYTGICGQDMSTSVLATRTKEGGTYSAWTVKKAAHGHEKMLAEFIADYTAKIMEDM